MLTPDLDADTALLADLNRLLREGLASVAWSDDDPTPRFTVTARGRDVLDETEDVDEVRGHVRSPDVADAGASAPDHRS